MSEPPAIPWRVCLIEGVLLGAFIVSATFFAAVLGHPRSGLAAVVTDPLARRALMGVAMAATAVCLIYSPWGKRSGPHLNPAVTLCFWRLGQMRGIDAVKYVAAQFAGALAAAWGVKWAVGTWASDPSVRHVATTPGVYGAAGAWAGEFAIGAVMMGVVLAVNKRPPLAPWAGCIAAGLVAMFIIVESPVSGMSMNPARTLGPATAADVWTGIWVYFTAPVAGMVLAMEWHRRRSHWSGRELCGKLTHPHNDRCVFRCNCRARGRIPGEGQQALQVKGKAAVDANAAAL